MHDLSALSIRESNQIPVVKKKIIFIVYALKNRTRKNVIYNKRRLRQFSNLCYCMQSSETSFNETGLCWKQLFIIFLRLPVNIFTKPLIFKPSTRTLRQNF